MFLAWPAPVRLAVPVRHVRVHHNGYVGAPLDNAMAAIAVTQIKRQGSYENGQRTLFKPDARRSLMCQIVRR